MTFRPPRPEALVLEGPAGNIEAILEAGDNAPGDGVAVVCHPHPLYEGTMHNKVVHMLARSMQRLGLVTLKFNFRGVGDSDGQYAEGFGETDDALAVADWLRDRWPDSPLWLAGFSFGAMVAIRCANRRDTAQLITVAPAVHKFEGLVDNQRDQPGCPWLLIQGDADDVVDCDQVIDWFNGLAPGPELLVVPGADHFFHGRLNDLRDVLLQNLDTTADHSS